MSRGTIQNTDDASQVSSLQNPRDIQGHWVEKGETPPIKQNYELYTSQIKAIRRILLKKEACYCSKAYYISVVISYITSR